MGKHRVLVTGLIAALVACSLGLGCSGAGDQEQWLLEKAPWVARDIAGIGAVGDTDGVLSTLVFEGATVVGTGGVNSYSGKVVTSSTGTIAISELASTLMAGPEPAMTQEAVFMDALAKASSFKVSEVELILLDSEGKQLIRFESAN